MNNTFAKEHLKLIETGLLLFNEQKYWECHEELEHHWLEASNDPIRNIYWAIIQVAASMIHYRDQNLVGARGLLFKAKEKLKRCEELYVESKFLFQNTNWQEFKDEVRKVSNPDDLTAYQQLFEFRFIWELK